MAAVIQLHRVTGSGPTFTSVFSTTVRTDDRDAPDDNTITGYPVPVPGSGSNWSFWACFRLYCAVAPVTLVNNFRVYGIGINTMAANVSPLVCQATAYVQAFAAGGAGAEMNLTNIPSMVGSVQPFTAYTFASPLTLAGSTSVTGYFGNYLYMQGKVDPGAPSGPTGPQLTWVQWDET